MHHSQQQHQTLCVCVCVCVCWCGYWYINSACSPHSSLHRCTPGITAAGTEREPLIIDPFFRDQFEMAKATPAYMRFMDELPEVLVTTEAQLRQLVKILCREMHEAFVKHGASIPPWRGKESLLSKWRLPRLYDPTERGGSPHIEGCGTVKASWQAESSAAVPVVVNIKGSNTQTGMGSARGAAVTRQPPPRVQAMRQQCCGTQS